MIVVMFLCQFEPLCLMCARAGKGVWTLCYVPTISDRDSKEDVFLHTLPCTWIWNRTDR